MSEKGMRKSYNACNAWFALVFKDVCTSPNLYLFYMLFALHFPLSTEYIYQIEQIKKKKNYVRLSSLSDSLHHTFILNRLWKNTLNFVLL